VSVIANALNQTNPAWVAEYFLLFIRVSLQQFIVLAMRRYRTLFIQITANGVEEQEVRNPPAHERESRRMKDRRHTAGEQPLFWKTARGTPTHPSPVLVGPRDQAGLFQGYFTWKVLRSSPNARMTLDRSMATTFRPLIRSPRPSVLPLMITLGLLVR